MNIHIIGIAGNLTHNLALCLHHLGHTVTGSDSNFDEPMQSRLAAAGFLTKPWYDASRIHSSLDLVIMPMSMMLDNPEYLAAQQLGIKIQSFPEFIYDMSKDKQRIVIAGSHGKTTTTSMIMRVLKQHGIAFNRLVGSQVPWFDAMVGLSDAPVIIIEWDEYPDNKINLSPKFLKYQPHIAILNGIERDHINIFPTRTSYHQCFHDLVASIPQAWILYYNASDPQVIEVIKAHPQTPKQAYFPQAHYVDTQGITIAVDQIDRPYPLQIFWAHNMINLAAAKQICMDIFDLSESQILQALQSFPGSYIRMQSILETDQLKIYRDFAHSPSKVLAATIAIKNKYPTHHVIAVYELGTISANNALFLPEFAHTLDTVDTALIYQNPAKKYAVEKQYIHGGFEAIETLDQVRQWFVKPDLDFITDKDILMQAIQSSIHHPKSVILFMSNSNFDHLDMQDMIQKITWNTSY